MNGWKLVAWILIIVVTLETALIVYSVKLANQSTVKENECINQICGEGYLNGTYDSYNYKEGTCYCYLKGKAELINYIG